MKGHGAERRVPGGTEVATRSAVFQKELPQLQLELEFPFQVLLWFQIKV